MQESKVIFEQNVSRRTFLAAAAAGLTALPAAAQVSWAPSRTKPNIVLIVLDTVRRDHMSCYANARDTTPFLRELASESRRYENAYSTSCWTVPAHASLFTGLYLVSHATTWENCRLDRRLTTLAEVLQRAGYRTSGISENPAVGAPMGFAKGFQSFVIAPHSADKESVAVRLLDEAISQAGDNPFFAFVNLIGAHDPYNSSGDFFGAYLSNPAYRDKYKIDLLDTLVKGKPIDASWLKHLSEHYDAELRNVDRLVEQMANVLKHAGCWDDTVFVVLSDHGENLGDHGFLNHQFCLYESLIRIPLIIRYPTCFPAGTNETAPVQITDLFPTLLDLAGVDVSQHPHQGSGLLPGHPQADRAVLAEAYVHARFRDLRTRDRRWKHPRVRRYMRRLKSLRTGSMKLIQASDGERELFDLFADPDELCDLSGNPTMAASRDFLSRRLQGLIDCLKTQQPPPPREGANLEKDTEATLEALGYL